MTTVTTNLARNFKGTHTEGRSPEELRELVSHVGAELELAPAEDIVEWAVATRVQGVSRRWASKPSGRDATRATSNAATVTANV